MDFRCSHGPLLRRVFHAALHLIELPAISNGTRHRTFCQALLPTSLSPKDSRKLCEKGPKLNANNIRCSSVASFFHFTHSCSYIYTYIAGVKRIEGIVNIGASWKQPLLHLSTKEPPKPRLKRNSKSLIKYACSLNFFNLKPLGVKFCGLVRQLIKVAWQQSCQVTSQWAPLAPPLETQLETKWHVINFSHKMYLSNSGRYTICKWNYHWHVIVFTRRKQRHAKHLIAVQMFAEKCLKTSQHETHTSRT